MLTPALYRTRITHLRRAPVHHYFEHSGYSWYVDIDRLPQLPRWLRPFARFDARDHLDGGSNDSLRQRIDAFLGERDIHANPIHAKGIGELGISGAAPSIVNAIYNATGIRVRDLPVTLDKLLAELPEV